jgi:hypothetical protein
LRRDLRAILDFIYDRWCPTQRHAAGNPDPNTIREETR